MVYRKTKTIKNGRVDEYNKLLLDYATRETKGVIDLYKKKIKKKQLEINVMKTDLTQEQIELKEVIKKMQRPSGSAYDKLSALSFVKNIEMKNTGVLVTTRDLIVHGKGTFNKKDINLGEYTINIPASGRLTVKRKAGGIRPDGSGPYHMFVTNTGALCTGDDRLNDKMNEWRRFGLVHLVVSLVWDILSNYDVKQGTHYATYGELKKAHLKNGGRENGNKKN